MKYLEAPNYKEITTSQSIFLCGGITNCEEWQSQVVEELSDFDDLTICNPRRKDFQIFMAEAGWEESKKQIEWEYNYLRNCNQILVWFSEKTVQPIVLFELGSILERIKTNKQELFIGAHPNYPRLFDLQCQCRLAGFTDNIHERLVWLINSVRMWNRGIEYSKRK
jgi:hypothetical protein